MQDAGDCDVLVIGGGPAGSTVAALLAETGKHVVLLEKERHPRFHIGESLLPLNQGLFDRLGVAAEIRRIGVHKPGAEIISDAHRRAVAFRFADNPRIGVDHSYHVRRAEFDALLFDNSRRLGASAHDGVRVTAVELAAGSRAIVTARSDDGECRWRPRFVVDASGRDTLLAGRLGLKRVDKRNNTAALYGHFRNMPRRDGTAEGMISVHLVDDGWFWMIPLPQEVMSVGVVGTKALFRRRTGNLGEVFARAVAASPSVAERMAPAEPLLPLAAAANYSYDARCAAGDGYVLVGDAFAFIDPLFSSGVMMAMSSAGLAAEAIGAWFADRGAGMRRLHDYERRLRRGLATLGWLISRINTPVLRDMFMGSADLFDTRHGLLAILAGDFYEPPSVLSPLVRFRLAHAALSLAAPLGWRLDPTAPTLRLTRG